ncbi:hypothetical protein [Eubacterium sp.]|uniref:hypothetical protein n=1 Tax=Eubacterium sp. TaxID=142586 RepID=UPI0025F052B3|nr:hypothetical protein [Eubacterium sp.]MCR5629925.1 hypothetical protein [Eubacterium sp.]
MNIEQAKEIFNIFLQDLEMDEDGNSILELRLNPDDTWSHFTPEDIKAFKMAFKSLDMWDKFYDEIEKILDKRYCEKEGKVQDKSI